MNFLATQQQKIIRACLNSSYKYSFSGPDCVRHVPQYSVLQIWDKIQRCISVSEKYFGYYLTDDTVYVICLVNNIVIKPLSLIKRRQHLRLQDNWSGRASNVYHIPQDVGPNPYPGLLRNKRVTATGAKTQTSRLALR